MTITYNTQSNKYTVVITLYQSYTSIKSPEIIVVGEYDTVAEAKIASDAAVLIRDVVTEKHRRVTLLQRPFQTSPYLGRNIPPISPIDPELREAAEILYDLANKTN